MKPKSRLADIERRVSRSTLTPGPWHHTIDGSVKRGNLFIFHGRDWDTAEDDAEFAAHAREDVPWLIARVKQLEAALSKATHGDLSPAEAQDVLSLDPVNEE